MQASTKGSSPTGERFALEKSLGRGRVGARVRVRVRVGARAGAGVRSAWCAP